MRKRIFVVEDQEDLRAILRDLLSASGYTIIEAVDGEAGIAKAKSERPNLILMDIQMPVVDGYEATRRIKAEPGLKSIPIVAVSSFAMKGDEEQALAAGCDHYITSHTARCSCCASFKVSSATSRDNACRVYGSALGRHLTTVLVCGVEVCGLFSGMRRLRGQRQKGLRNLTDRCNVECRPRSGTDSVPRPTMRAAR